MPVIRVRVPLGRGLAIPIAQVEALEGHRRLTNLVPTGRGLRSTSPPAAVFVPFGSAVVHSLFYFNGKVWVAYGTNLADETGAIVKNDLLTGVPLHFAVGPPTLGKADYMFFTNGSDMFKVSPSPHTVSLWGITPPSALTGVGTSTTAIPAKSKVIDNLNSTTGWTPTDCAVVADTTSYIQGGASLRLESGSGGIIPKDTHAHIDSNNTINLGQFTTAGDSADQDFIALFVRANRPRNLVSVNITFSVGDTTFANAYSIELPVRVVTKQQRRRLVGLGDIIPLKDQATFLERNAKKTQDLSTIAEVGRRSLMLAKKAWSRVTIPKGQFEELGQAGAAGYTWADVKAVRLEVETAKSGGTKVWFDYLHMFGGYGLLGDYQYTFTFLNSTTGTRSNPPMDADGNVLFVEAANVERSGVRLTGLNSASLQTSDLQVDRLEIWRTIGNGDLYFKAGEVTMTGNPRTAPATYDDTAADYVGMFGSGAVTTLDHTKQLQTDNTSVRGKDGARRFRTVVAQPYQGRFFFAGAVGTTEGHRVYYSPIGRLEAIAGFLEVSTPDDPVQALVPYQDRLLAFTQNRLFEILNADEPFIANLIVGVPGTRAPKTVVPTPNGVFWLGWDGVYLYDGTATRISDPIHGIFNTAGGVDGLSVSSFTRAAAWGRNEYWLATLGPDSKALVFNIERQAWRVVGDFQQGCGLLYVPQLNAMYGGLSNRVYNYNQEPLGTGVAQPVELLTGALPLDVGSRGVLQRVYVEQQQAGAGTPTSALTVIVDGVETPSYGSVFTTTRGIQEYAIVRSGTNFQIRITATDSGSDLRLYAVEADLMIPDPAP